MRKFLLAGAFLAAALCFGVMAAPLALAQPHDRGAPELRPKGDGKAVDLRTGIVDACAACHTPAVTKEFMGRTRRPNGERKALARLSAPGNLPAYIACHDAAIPGGVMVSAKLGKDPTESLHTGTQEAVGAAILARSEDATRFT